MIDINEVLGRIVRALVGLPPERLEVMFEIVYKMGGTDGKLWEMYLAQVLREGVESVNRVPEATMGTNIRIDRSVSLSSSDLQLRYDQEYGRFNDMIGRIARALVGLPLERLEVMLEIVYRFGGCFDKESWLTRFTEVLREGVGRATLEPEVSLDTLIRVDRSIRPVYPDWVKTVMHPELEPTGLVEYDLGVVDPWLHDGQKNGCSMEGNKLYEYLKEKKMLESCLSLRDGEEI